MTLSHSLYQRKTQTSLELSGWVFTCLWALGSTSSVMVGPVRLLIYLWWCTRIDSWHIVSWFAYISDLEFWSALVWSVISVLLCQHSFGDVWTCFSICSLRLCMCFFIASSLSISQSVLFGEIPCLMLVTILHWGIPSSLCSPDLLQILLLFILSLDLCESSYWGIPPSLSSLTFCRLLSLLDLFLDLCESSHWGIPL